LPQDEPRPQIANEFDRALKSFRIHSRAAARRNNEEVADKARSVLERVGVPMSISEIVQAMKADGWPGFIEAESEWAESRQLYRILQGRRLNFKLVGRNVWALVNDGPSPAPPALEDTMT
jgi:hypothetical protein